jgi:hypothetical protein
MALIDKNTLKLLFHLQSPHFFAWLPNPNLKSEAFKNILEQIFRGGGGVGAAHAFLGARHTNATEADKKRSVSTHTESDHVALAQEEEERRFCAAAAAACHECLREFETSSWKIDWSPFHEDAQSPFLPPT